jgi:hypothetical protein
MQLAVFHCTHPDLDVTDKALLAYLALYASFGSGGDSRPGNLNMQDVLKFEKRGTIKRLNQNIARGLIERTEMGHGQGKASIYRLCLESAYYPDQTPGGESLTERCTSSCTDDDQERCTSSCTDDDQERCTSSCTNKLTKVHADADKGAPESLKGAPESMKGAQAGATHQDPPKEHQNTTNTQNGGGAVFLEKKNLATIGTFGKRIFELEAAIKEHGQNIVDKALDAIIAEGFDENVKSKVAITLFRLPNKIAEVKALIKLDADTARCAGLQDAFIKAQTELEIVLSHTRYNLGFEWLSNADQNFLKQLRDQQGCYNIDLWCKWTDEQRERAKTLGKFCVEKHQEIEAKLESGSIDDLM